MKLARCSVEILGSGYNLGALVPKHSRAYEEQFNDRRRSQTAVPGTRDAAGP